MPSWTAGVPRQPVVASRRITARIPPWVRRGGRRSLRLVLIVAFLVGFAPVSALADGSGGGTQASDLPLLRWANAVATIHTHYGVGSVLSAGDPFMTGIASLLFQVSALLWQVLGTVVNAAQGANAIRLTVERVNPLYERIGTALLGTTGAESIVVVVIIVGAGMVAYQAYRRGSGTGGALRGLFGVLLPIGMLVVTVDAAAGAASRTVGAPGSPSWVVGTVTGWTTTLAGSVARLSAQLPTSNNAGIGGAADTATADCTKYIEGLENLYTATSATPGTGPTTLQTADSLDLSQIWESAVMVPWIDAQFGPGALGDKSFCHLLEIQGNVSAADQIQAMAHDVPNGPYSQTPGPTWSELLAQPPPGGAGPAKYPVLLGPEYANGDDDLRRNMIAWAECDYEGSAAADDGWTVDAAFTNVFSSPPSDADKTCSTWWEQGNTKPPPTGGTLTTDGPFDFEDDNAIVTATTANGRDSAPARNYIEGLNGHNAGLALSTSIIALGSSVTYTWSLGGLALGVLIGKLSLIILVACMPIFLLLAAIPSATTRRAATKAFGLTFASLLSTFTFSVLMGLLLLFIGLLQDTTIGLFGNTGTLAGLIQGLIPLAALYLLRKLLRLVGMDSITSLRGAIKTTAAFGQMGLRTVDAMPRPSRRTVTAADGTRDPTIRQAPAGSEARRRGRPGILAGEQRPGLAGPSTTRAATPLAWNTTWRQLVAAGTGKALPAGDGGGSPGPGGPSAAQPSLSSGPRLALPVVARAAAATPEGRAVSSLMTATANRGHRRPLRAPAHLRQGTPDTLPANRPAQGDGPVDLQGRNGPPLDPDRVVLRLDATTGEPLAVGNGGPPAGADEDGAAEPWRPPTPTLIVGARSAWAPPERS